MLLQAPLIKLNRSYTEGHGRRGRLARKKKGIQPEKESRWEIAIVAKNEENSIYTYEIIEEYS